MDDSVPGCRLTRSFGAVQLARAELYSRLRAKSRMREGRVGFVTSFMEGWQNRHRLAENSPPALLVADRSVTKSDA